MTEEALSVLDQTRSILRTNPAELGATLTHVRPADLAEVYQMLDDEERSDLIYSLPARLVAEMMVLLDEAERGEAVEEMDDQSLTALVQELAPDDAVDLLAELPDEQREEVLEQIPDEQAAQLESLMQYGEDTAGGIMTPEFIALPESATVGDTVVQIQETPPQEDIHEVYVLDPGHRLVGVIPMRRLVTSGRGTTLGTICQREPISVSVSADQEEVSKLFQKYSLSALPVVDETGKLLGRIAYDDAMDVVQEEADEDIYRMAGTDAAELETTSSVHAARVRLSWLLPCLFATCITAAVISSFQQYAAKPLGGAQIALLMVFMPMIGAMGGNCGIQSSTIIVRGFATGDVGVRTLGRTFMREFRIAGLVAIGCGLAAGLASGGFINVAESIGLTTPGAQIDILDIGLAVGMGMFSAVLTATLLGILLPFIFRGLGVDPAIASGPIITTINDLVSVSIYLLIAILVLA